MAQDYPFARELPHESDQLRMKSVLGLVLAGGATLLYAIAFGAAVRPGAGWLAGQWLFLVALPYNWTLLHVSGVSNFSPDAPTQIVAAWLFDVAFAYVAGAAVEAVARALLQLFGRAKYRA